jgi:hypothetical protein
MAEAPVPSHPTRLAPVPGADAAGQPMPHARWRVGRVCSRCGALIVRGPVEVCGQGHWEDVPSADVPPPPPPQHSDRTQDLLVRGYWVRWIGALAAVILVAQALLVVPVLLSLGVLAGWLGYAVAAIFVLALLGLIFAPPLIQPPTARWIEAETRKNTS